jgi:hypothetical protein
LPNGLGKRSDVGIKINGWESIDEHCTNWRLSIGSVRYECSAEPVFTGNCHCRDCQKATGAAYMPAFAVPAQAVKIAGEIKYYDTRFESGNTFGRGFCPICGGRVFGRTSGFPQFILITAGSLDEPSRFEPSMDFFTSSAQPWDHMNPALPKFPKQPKA